jgi:GDP-L-fucose synthase
VSLKNPFLNLDYLYIEDAAEAVVTIARKRRGGTINVGSGISVTPREITDQIRNLRNSNSKIIDLQNSRIKTKGYISDNSLLRSLGWAQKVSLEEGLRKFLSYN